MFRVSYGQRDFSVQIEGVIIDDRYIDITTKIEALTQKKILDAEDKLIREGLIKLGWTPPD